MKLYIFFKYVSGSEISHFVSFYMNQINKREEKIESAQYVVEIFFNVTILPYVG